MIDFLLRILAFIPAVVLHEVSHGVVANHYGDDTAKRAGRLTLNPISHMDPFGSVLLPIMMAISGFPPIGYAKPVPVNVGRLRKPRNQSVLVSLAGPFTNIVLSFVGWVALALLINTGTNVNPNFITFLVYFGLVNLFMAAFNLIPIPPFDGSALLERLVPRAHLDRYFAIRARALPFALLIMIIVLNTSLGASFFGHLQHWWYSTLPGA
jgi:Zn-dependent protease